MGGCIFRLFSLIDYVVSCFLNFSLSYPPGDDGIIDVRLNKHMSRLCPLVGASAVGS